MAVAGELQAGLAARHPIIRVSALLAPRLTSHSPSRVEPGTVLCAYQPKRSAPSRNVSSTLRDENGSGCWPESCQTDITDPSDGIPSPPAERRRRCCHAKHVQRDRDSLIGVCIQLSNRLGAFTVLLRRPCEVGASLRSVWPRCFHGHFSGRAGHRHGRTLQRLRRLR